MFYLSILLSQSLHHSLFTPLSSLLYSSLYLSFVIFLCSSLSLSLHDKVKAFGSFTSGLSLPSSDLDMVICLPNVHMEAAPEAPGGLEGRNSIKESWQQVTPYFLQYFPSLLFLYFNLYFYFVLIFTFIIIVTLIFIFIIIFILIFISFLFSLLFSFLLSFPFLFLFLFSFFIFHFLSIIIFIFCRILPDACQKKSG